MKPSQYYQHIPAVAQHVEGKRGNEQEREFYEQDFSLLDPHQLRKPIRLALDEDDMYVQNWEKEQLFNFGVVDKEPKSGLAVNVTGWKWGTDDPNKEKYGFIGICNSGEEPYRF